MMEETTYLNLAGKKIKLDAYWTETYKLDKSEFKMFYARYRNQTISDTTEKGLVKKLHELIQ